MVLSLPGLAPDLATLMLLGGFSFPVVIPGSVAIHRYQAAAWPATWPATLWTLDLMQCRGMGRRSRPDWRDNHNRNQHLRSPTGNQCL